MFEAGDTIFVERIEDGLGPLEIDLSVVNSAERRISEISFVTAAKAPELLAAFNEAYVCAARYYARLELELDRAHNRAQRRRAIIILDEVPGIVKEKNLATSRSPMGSEDIREAIVMKDDLYFSMQDKISAFRATKEFVYMKMRSLEMAYNAVKKILDTQRSQLGPRLNGTIPESAEAGDIVVDEAPVPPPVATKSGGWGKPKY